MKGKTQRRNEKQGRKNISQKIKRKKKKNRGEGKELEKEEKDQIFWYVFFI